MYTVISHLQNSFYIKLYMRSRNDDIIHKFRMDHITRARGTQLKLYYYEEIYI